jgi:hypothetical protein
VSILIWTVADVLQASHQPVLPVDWDALLAVAVAVGLLGWMSLRHVARLLVGRRAARRRADALVRAHLSGYELSQLKRFGQLDVPSRKRPGRVYQVRAQSGRVFVREAGLCTMELCIRAGIDLPGDEHVLAHKLMIQGAEEEYLARANVIWSRGQATVSGRLSRLE